MLTMSPAARFSLASTDAVSAPTPVGITVGSSWPEPLSSTALPESPAPALATVASINDMSSRPSASVSGTFPASAAPALVSIVEAAVLRPSVSSWIKRGMAALLQVDRRADIEVEGRGAFGEADDLLEPAGGRELRHQPVGGEEHG